MPEGSRSQKRLVTAEALLTLRSVGELTVHPEGFAVVFTADEVDFEESRRVSHLFYAEVGRGRPMQLTWSEVGEHGPKWSPDGKWLAFLSQRGVNLEEAEEDPKDQVWLLPPNGEAKKLTDAADGVDQYEWLPDGGRLLYLAPEPKPAALKGIDERLEDERRDALIEDAEKTRRQIWSIDVESEEKRLVLAGDPGVDQFKVSPDGQWVVYSTNYTGEGRHDHKHDLWLLKLETGETRKLIERENTGWAFRFSPDSRQLAFLGCANPQLGFSHQRLFVADLDTGEFRQANPDLDLGIEEFDWNYLDGKLYFTVGLGATTPLMRMNADGSELETIIGDDWVVSGGLGGPQFQVAPRGVVAAMQNAAEPPEVYLVRDNGRLTRLSALNRDFATKTRIARQQVVRWQSDGREIEGVLVYPIDYEEGKRYPTVVAVHGGPASRATNAIRSYTMPQLFAAHGYAVLLPNYRGSTGYSNAFVTSNHRDLGGGDYRDIMAGVDWAVEAGIADPNRLGVMGGSYGGYMVNWIVTQTNRFQAAASLFGIFSLITDYSNSAWPRWEREYLGAFYWDDFEIYASRSPARYAANIKTPVLIMHGEDDGNTFIANSKEMYQALRDKGDVAVEFVRYPREGHGLGEPNHRLDEARRWLEWFDRYLKPETGAPRRVGDLIKLNGWELRIVGAEPLEFGKARGEENPLLRVEFALAHRNGPTGDLTLNLNEIKLADTAGRQYRPIGIPVTLYGATVIVEGRNLVLKAPADKDSGVVAAPVAAAFDLPRKGGEYLLTVRDFPPVRLFVEPKRRKSPAKKEKKSQSGEPTLPERRIE